MSSDALTLDRGGDARLRGTRERTMLDLLGAVLRGWRTVLWCAVLALAAAVIVYFVQPDEYVAGTVLVPAAETQGRGQLLLSQLPQGVGSLLGGAAGGSSSERLVGAVLKSRTLLDSIAARVGRTREERDQVRWLLEKRLRTQRAQDGSIAVQISAPDAQLAARIASAFPVLVNETIARVIREAATRRRQFLQQQVDVAREELVQSEDRMLQFQRQRQAPDLPEQARRTIEAAAALQAEVYQAELEVARLRRVATENNPELRAAEAALAARQAQLTRMNSQNSASGVLIPIGQGAELRIAATRVLREYTADERIYAALTASLADAQISANENMPVLSVLDPAEVPRGPARSVIAMIVAPVFGLLLGCALVVARDTTERLRELDEHAAFFDAWSSFKGDLRRVATLGRGGARTPAERR